jgi:hypothetical protein
MLKLGRRIVHVFVGSAMLAACGPPVSGTVGPSGPSERALSGRPVSRTWMAPDAKSKDLLYISTYTYNGRDVLVFSYPGGKREGTLTGFSEPSGECTDKAGDVFITNYYGADVTEYAHGGTVPIATLADQPYSNPIDCSVDPTTGNLAVANAFGSSGDGNIAIYPGAQGAPRYYSDPTLYSMIGCAYDNAGNLFIVGQDHTLRFALAELAGGVPGFTEIKVPDKRSGYAYRITWDGTYMAMYYGANSIRRMRIIGSRAKVAGTVALDGGYVLGYFSIVFGSRGHGLVGTRLVGPEYNSGEAQIWKYPGGGESISTIDGAGVPVGTAVSFARK